MATEMHSNVALPGGRLFTVAEVADILGYHRASVWRAVASGRIPAIDLALGLGRPRYRVQAEQLEAFLSERRTGAQLEGSPL